MNSEAEPGEIDRFLETWMAVRQLVQAANFNRFQGAGLSATQFMVLNLLPTDSTGTAMGELARRMNLRPATVAQTVDSLEARGLVERRRSTADQRRVEVHVTADGRELQNAAHTSFRAQIEVLFRNMPPAERAGLLAGLEGLLRAAASLHQPTPRAEPAPSR